MVRKSLEIVATLLDPAERQSVLGDIEERGPNTRALFDLIGLVLLRQLQAWTSWRPWAITASLAIPALLAGSAAHPIAYVFRTGHLVAYERAAGTFLMQPWVTLGAPAAAWAIGFALGRLGKHRAASVLPLLIGASIWTSYQAALGSLRLALPPSWSTRFQLDVTATQHIATAVQSLDETGRFIAAIGVMALLTAIPCILGFARGLRNRPPHLFLAIILTAMCCTDFPRITDIVISQGRQIPIAVVITRRIVALWPLLYLLAISRKSREVAHA